MCFMTYVNFILGLAVLGRYRLLKREEGRTIMCTHFVFETKLRIRSFRYANIAYWLVTMRVVLSGTFTIMIYNCYLWASLVFYGLMCMAVFMPHTLEHTYVSAADRIHYKSRFGIRARAIQTL